MNRSAGLEDVVAAYTRLSEVDGARGRLRIAGVDVEALAAAASFERACALLWECDEAHVRQALADARDELLTGPHAEALRRAANHPDAMVAIRAGLGGLDEAREAPRLVRLARVTAVVGVIVALWLRARDGSERLASCRRGADHATDLLRIATGDVDPARARALGAYMATVSEHGLNASTFAARVVASTESDLVSAVIAGVGALRGRLHGGAPGPVLDMLEAIGAPERAEAYVREALGRGERIMGMGHRVYRVRDPRAAALERAARELVAAGVRAEMLMLAPHVERAAKAALAARHPDRVLAANVEFYTAVLLDAVGLPREAFTAVFAAARVAGWCAHVEEQRATGRLIRPRAVYIGPGSERAA